jgi:hypothetical protein
MVAVKAVELPRPVSGAERRAFDEAFFEEARRAGRLSHPAIVLAHDAGRDAESDTLFSVFEYVEGETLADHLAAGGSFDARPALRLVRQLADALHHAHRHGVVHRDLRPANIMLLPSGDAKIMDLGVARLESARMTVNSIKQAFGAPLYMSPEQAVGESVDARSDLFSLGSIAYRLLTGRDAFAAEDAPGVLGRVVHDTPPRPSRLAQDLPPGVDELIAHALAKSRKDRYRDAGLLVEDVDDILAGQRPRHSALRDEIDDTQPYRAAGGIDNTQPYREALQASGLSVAAATRAPAAPQQTIFQRRTTLRVMVGLLALLIVGGVDLFRRTNEGASPGAASAASPIATTPTAGTAPADGAPVIDSGRPSVVARPARAKRAAAAPARLVLELNHTLRRGTLVLAVDGAEVLQEPIAAPGRSILGVRWREGRARRVVELKPGRHQITVQVSWDDERRSRTAVGTFPAAGSQRLVASLSRLTKKLSLDWR